MLFEGIECEFTYHLEKVYQVSNYDKYSSVAVFPFVCLEWCQQRRCLGAFICQWCICFYPSSRLVTSGWSYHLRPGSGKFPWPHLYRVAVLTSQHRCHVGLVGQKHKATCILRCQGLKKLWVKMGAIKKAEKSHLSGLNNLKGQFFCEQLDFCLGHFPDQQCACVFSMS